jgi:hypothetical protein
MRQHSKASAALVLALASLSSGGVMADAPAAGDWHFGIGTGMSSFSLDGDLGFATPRGGFIKEIDLDNGETSDLIDSAMGANASASNGRWDILLSYGTSTLEDSASGLDAEWDRTSAEMSAVYNFAEVCGHKWGVLAGVRYTEHEWDIGSSTGAFPDVEPGDDWTDGIVGLTHSLRISEQWMWRNRIDAGFGDTEEAYFASTAIVWQPLDHWQFNLNAKFISTEFGDDNDINDPDFYLYDVDETSFGLGLALVW